MNRDGNLIKRSSRIHRFDELPPRVIIHDILQFHLFRVNDVLSDDFDDFLGNNGETVTVNPWFEGSNLYNGTYLDRFCLFGYFRRDGLRNIWFVFTSLKFGIGKESEVFLDISKVFHIELCFGVHEDSIDFVKNRLCAFSGEMFSIRSVIVDIFPLINPSTKIDKIINIILEFSNFLRLEKIYFPPCIGEKMHEFPEFFKGLKHLNLDIFKVKDDRFFTTSVYKFKKLEKLSMSRVCFEKLVEVVIPNLKILRLVSCENICIIPGEESINHLSVRNYYETGICKEEFLPIFEKSRNLKTCKICSNEDFWMLDPIFPFMSETGSLKRIKFRSSSMSIEHIVKFKETKLSSLDTLEFSFCKRSNNNSVLDFFSNKHLPSLRKLSMTTTNGPIRSDLHWPFTDQLRNLYLSGQTPDLLFERNSFQSLEVLKISSNRVMTGAGWKSYEFPNLYSIWLEFMENFQDVFFQHFRGSTLKVVYLLQIGPKEGKPTCFQGRNWSSLLRENLEILKCIDCYQVDDLLFHESEFPNLKELEIKGNYKVGFYM